MDMLLNKYILGTDEIEGLMRVTKYPYPEKALREAVMNAIVHRDYSGVAETYIRVYPDRVRISNPGILPAGWTENDLLKEHGSEPANPAIAKVFFDMGYTERWGSGIGMICEECRAMNICEPEYNITESSIEIVFRLPEVPAEDIPERDDAMNGLSPAELKVYDAIAEGSAVTREEISGSAGISLAAVKRSVTKLTETGLIERIGSDRNGKWVLKKK
jgi:ATP-dependent DNA helicase RecG